MNILVTGSRGFIGTALVQYLELKGYEVTEFNKQDGDLQFYNSETRKIDHLIHLAANTFVPDSWKKPFEFYSTNSMGTLGALEFCRKNDCSMTYVSSYVYGVPEYLPIDEKHKISPNTPYNHSKLLAEELCAFYNINFKVPVTILRPFNIFGINQNENFLIPTIIKQLLDPKVNSIRVQNLEPKRDFLFIDDFLEVLQLTIKRTDFEIFNVGYGKSYSVKEIIDTAFEVSGITKPIEELGIKRENEVMDVVADTSKLEKVLRWQPKIGFKNGIMEIVKSQAYES